MDINQESLIFHKKNKGKIAIQVKSPLQNKKDLALVYTPGVAAVSQKISRRQEMVDVLTNRGNSVAIVSDGTAVLGLGNVGPKAALPVMEGKAVIFKKFADIDAVPLCIKAESAADVIDFVKKIELTFAAVNLEDIAAPRCFEAVRRLEKELSIPVFHDDQDGTAIVVLAALINACRVLRRDILEQKVVVNGAGAAGSAIVKLLLFFGIKNLVVLDSRGLIYKNRPNLSLIKKEIAKKTNPSQIKGGLKEALAGADVFIGVSKGGLVKKTMIKSMNKKPIIFAMANPLPEVMPKDALAAGAAIVGTGRSDFPNQINNALVFPGIFRGLLDNHIRLISNEMKVAVAQAVADSLKPEKSRILPSITNKKVVKIIAKAMKRFKQ
jgi:malate dehydrogenase (oxaloacetate-decarboxylating)